MKLIAPIGLTGGIAEGKTTVLGFLAEAGLRTASADEAARHVIDDSEMQAAACALLGLEQFDRGRVREIISADAGKRRAYNRLLHSRITGRLREAGADIVEVPLLIETAMLSFFGEIWIVSCGKEEQFRRLSARVGNADAARSLLALQIQTRAKIAFADQVIRTDQGLDCVQKVTNQLAADYIVRRNRA